MYLCVSFHFRGFPFHSFQLGSEYVQVFLNITVCFVSVSLFLFVSVCSVCTFLCFSSFLSISVSFVSVFHVFCVFSVLFVCLHSFLSVSLSKYICIFGCFHV